ncbi:MAG: hypothetical protein IJO46_01750, partial [Thermoguttaceae bacterium]|nr:hypothetical protein [Thermoguttaceae bacterium]
AMVGGMTGASVASKSDGAMDAMGASVSAASREDAVAFDARKTKPEAASWEARTETFNLADQDSRKFDRASAAGAEPLALDDKSSADDESAFMFSVSGDDKKETPTDGAEPAFNFPTAVSCEKAAASLGMNAMTAAPVSSQDERREAALEKAKANFSALADSELVDEPDADATVATEKRGLDVRFYPTGGRLVAGRENVVWFECVDADGRPVVGEFALNDSTGRVATAKTSEGGVGSLRWTPDADETYSLETAFNGKVAKIVETDKIVKNYKAGGEEERVAAEEAALGAFALNDTCEDFHPAEPPFETFRFAAPTATVERVAFSVPSRVLDAGKSVEFEIWCENEAPLAATVEKNGVALAQRVWTAKKGRRRVVVPLDSDVSGVLNVSLWNCARTPFEKIGSASVYRKPTVAPPTLAATLERNDGGRRALRVAVERQKDWENAEPVGLEAFWSPTLDDALAALELDETLLYASDERRAETLATLEPPTAAEPVLFDNLLEMKENALKKLNAFWLGEAGLAGRVVGLGFAGCGALALLTVFCVLFGALKARRGAVVVLFCAALATFFYFERRRIDFSETLSQAIAVSVDESKAAQRDANGVATAANVPNDGAEEATLEGVRPAALYRIDDVDATQPALGAGWSVPLTGKLATTDVGVVLVKAIADDGTRAWKAIPLGESGLEESGETR